MSLMTINIHILFDDLGNYFNEYSYFILLYLFSLFQHCYFCISFIVMQLKNRMGVVNKRGRVEQGVKASEHWQMI